MKHAKKLASLLLALVMVLAMGVTSFAATETGTINIENAVEGQTYAVYQILDLESYDPITGAYLYKAYSDWEDWLKTQTEYISIDTEGYVTWAKKDKDGNDIGAAEFAKLALAHAKEKNISASANPITATVDENGKVEEVQFTNLNLGYYLVDSTMGTLCALDTTNPHATVKEKNVEPTNDKTVGEGNNYGDSNDAAIGDTVTFKSTITAQAGAQNYVLHDKMDAGLTFGTVSSVTLTTTVGDKQQTSTVNANDYTVTPTPGDNCTFHVTFTPAFCDTLKANDQIVVTYTATVNENAKVGKDEGNGNSSWLKYGEKSDFTTTHSETTTYTWNVDVFKYTEGEKDQDGKLTEVALSGAIFTLSKDADGKYPIALVCVDNGIIPGEKEYTYETAIYRVATKAEIDDEKVTTSTKITTNGSGEFTIKGLDSGTYYLKETVAPTGYNILKAPITIIISDKGVVNGTTDAPQGVDKVKVLNQSGNELPSTGGMGTTIFYVLGTILLLGSAVLLITRRRMNAEK